MPVQNIFGQAPRIRSIGEYENELAQQQGNQLALRSQQMNMLATQQKMAEDAGAASRGGSITLSP